MTILTSSRIRSAVRSCYIGVPGLVLSVWVPLTLPVGLNHEIPKRPQGAGKVGLNLPAAIGPVLCQVVLKGQVLDEIDQSDLLPCDQKDALLLCDGPNIEPIDEPVSNACRAQGLRVVSGEHATINVDQETMLTVEWLNLSNGGARTVASRRKIARASGPLEITIGRREDRFLLFSREGFSPVTVAAEELLGGQSWTLPPGRPGGEFVGLIQSAVVAPANLRFAGRTASGTGRVAIFHGVSAGRHSLERLYAGGLSGEESVFEVHEGASTFGVIEADNRGAARIATAEEECQSGAVLRLSKVTRTSTAAIRQMTVLDTVVETAEVFHDAATLQCVWQVAGLRAGTFIPEFTSDGSHWTGPEFKVNNQTVTAVNVVRGNAVVSGLVTINGVPFAGETVEFWRVGGTRRVSGITDAAGAFRLQLDEAGDYRFLLRRVNSVKIVSVALGTNVTNWSLDGAGLLVKVANLVDEQTVIELRRSTPRTWQRIELPRGESEYQLEGLAPGVYSISARSKRAASQTVDMTLKLHEESVVSLEMMENGGMLVLRDSEGRPITGARFPLMIPQPDETWPGSYLLNAIPRGAPIQIRPPTGFVPVCRLSWDAGIRTVTLARSSPTTLDVSGVSNLTMDAEIHGLPSAECGSRIADLGASRVETHDGRGLLLVERYPREGDFELRTSSERYRLTRTANGRIIAQPIQ